MTGTVVVPASCPDWHDFDGQFRPPSRCTLLTLPVRFRPICVIRRPPRVRLRWVEGGIPDQEPFMPVGKSGRQALRG